MIAYKNECRSFFAYKTIVFLWLQLAIQAQAQTDTIDNKLSNLYQQRDYLEDSLATAKKVERKQRVENTFKFLSYFNYTDRGGGVQFKGTEKYTPYEGKKINNIYIKIEKPFGCDSCSEISGAQAFGNKIHFNSKEWQAKQDILFKTGEAINPTIFTDTERYLWERNRYKYVSIDIIADSCDIPLDTNLVDVYIYLIDRLSYGLAAGYSNESLIIATNVTNFFGLPNNLYQVVGVTFNKNNPISYTLKYNYFNINKTQINTTTNFTINRLTRNYKTSIYRDFLSVKTKWAFNASYSYKNNYISFNNNYRDRNSLAAAKSHQYNLWLAYAIPLNKLMTWKNQQLKFIVATKINSIHYKNRPFIIDKNYNTTFINTSNFLVGIGLAHWAYYVEQNAYYLEAPEYLPKNWSLSVWVGPQLDELYGRRNNFSLTANYGKKFNKAGYSYSEFSTNGYLKDRRGQQMIVSLAQYWLTPSYKVKSHLFLRTILSSKFSYGFFYPEDRYFTINNNIRGFYSPTLNGSKSFTASIEQNMFLNKKVGLSKGMAYIFADVGWISDNASTLIIQSYFQYGIGFGLRIRSVDLGLGFLDFQFAFYPKGKSFNVNPFQFRLYEQSMNQIHFNNLFYENPYAPSIIN